MAPKKPPKVVEEVKIYKGIYKNQGLWRARIFEKDGEVYLGHFEQKEEAARAYDKAVLKIRGVEYAQLHGLNFDVREYEKDLKFLEEQPPEEFVVGLRKQGRAALPMGIFNHVKFK
mmetsp:Transcript_25834/g.31332  ORF Transcript_25834/g.31332 Transcript_25834/m.31332 type:complete len:116 (+) Transcript_25834:386-733(+)|eukprot:CAMPEP_0197862016 /NCGR_PEP_ID=MMETSP1438-20131217/38432_1 /TAXON_ID=1461541 /ORGANISM="Pterosperma sp., Strain CCMP1384" /LENGTH=115 /DNA_ID=CAMNT_0043479403 /DNA_START=372 /DNA_END=719 /DNA_ORIENTATION=-